MDNLVFYVDGKSETLVGFRKEVQASLKFFSRVGKDCVVISILKVWQSSSLLSWP